jgi:2-oxoglutarate dehydrogenase E2 component (dihydrolipoamide succinyltransferase)
MSIEVKIPAVGESITSGVLSGWHKQNGDLVNDGEALFTLETDKISTEVPATGSGRLEIKVDAGQEVKIGQVVALLYESAAAPAAGGAPVSAGQPSGHKAFKEALEPAVSASGGAIPGPAGFGTLPPSVRRIVEEEGVNLADVKGTGKHGFVTKSDLVEYLESKSEGAKAAAYVESDVPKQAPAVAPIAPIERTARTTRRKLAPLRKKIAAQLVLAQQNAAMLTTFNECDMSSVMKLRSQYQETFQKRHGVKLGFMSFFLKAAVEALFEVPAINARIDGDDLVENHYYDIGVAVGTERGLVVPVVRDADKKNFAELEKDVASYAKKARDGKLQLDDLTGGVFTITNGGIYGSLLSTPILNPPQSGILGMHKIQNRPVVVDDAIVVRPMMYLALSYDHRVVDGREAVTFLVRMKECIEDPTRLMLQG